MTAHALLSNRPSDVCKTTICKHLVEAEPQDIILNRGSVFSSLRANSAGMIFLLRIGAFESILHAINRTRTAGGSSGRLSPGNQLTPVHIVSILLQRVFRLDTSNEEDGLITP